MSLIGTLARAEAVVAGRAQPVATVRHRYLSQHPLVFVPLTTAGEVGAPLGALVGRDREAPSLLVVTQPRDRDLRFDFLAALATTVIAHMDRYANDVETEPATRNREESEVCADAPQIIVPNAAAADYVRLLGRSTRFRRTAEENPDELYPVPSRVPLSGRWLTHYGERARTPGASLLLSMTELLSRHWATGQSNLEDQHLGALLGWIDPPEGMTGADAARRAETGRGPDGLLLSPPAGPATDPAFDNTVLAPAMSRFDVARAAARAAGEERSAATSVAEAEVRALVESQLRPTWDDVWRGLDLLRALPEGGHVEERWKRDRWSYTGHRDRVRAGEPPQPKRDDAIAAAQKLMGRETAQVRLEAQEALDDPLVMAGRRLSGEAFAGEVTDVVMAYSEAKVPRPRPLVTVATADVPHFDADAKLYRALPGGKTQEARFVEWPAPGEVTVRLLNGMGRGKVPDEGSVPAAGDRVCWTLFEHAPRGGPELPDPEDTPWTHGGPPETAAAPAAPAPDPVTVEDFL
ncbi:hypothetical protein G3I60_19805 [Streptomyces sp. SID13666]|uniref:hypothetical protein n=1 Tax=unclassified Streptomyces TaxID=2593676 RepID=UPI0013BF69E7|nr:MULTISPECIES: hypothetical protein [unclassified Streptomyces]NEA56329.1 hypothetical protein [Streptomyces sp. SID13666]NEA73689.1 hypothetical protein [Streptomyces sp. SID13588]